MTEFDGHLKGIGLPFPKKKHQHGNSISSKDHRERVVAQFFLWPKLKLRNWVSYDFRTYCINILVCYAILIPILCGKNYPISNSFPIDFLPCFLTLLFPIIPDQVRFETIDHKAHLCTIK